MIEPARSRFPNNGVLDFHYGALLLLAPSTSPEQRLMAERTLQQALTSADLSPARREEAGRLLGKADR